MEAAHYFREQAAECRRLADDMAAWFERHGLLQLSRHYEAEARRAELDATATPGRSPRRREALHTETISPRIYG